VKTGTEIDGASYRDELLTKELLPATRSIADAFSRPMHRLIVHVKERSCFVVRLTTTAPDMWLPNSSDLNPVDYRIRE